VPARFGVPESAIRPSKRSTKPLVCGRLDWSDDIGESCDRALAFSEPEKSQETVKGIIEAAYDHGADLIVTPCPVCQMNVQVYQDQINATYATKFAMPVVY